MTSSKGSWVLQARLELGLLQMSRPCPGATMTFAQEGRPGRLQDGNPILLVAETLS